MAVMATSTSASTQRFPAPTVDPAADTALGACVGRGDPTGEVTWDGLDDGLVVDVDPLPVECVAFAFPPDAGVFDGVEPAGVPVGAPSCGSDATFCSVDASAPPRFASA